MRVKVGKTYDRELSMRIEAQFLQWRGKNRRENHERGEERRDDERERGRKAGREREGGRDIWNKNLSLLPALLLLRLPRC